MRRLVAAFIQIALSTLGGQIIGFAVLAVVARRIGPAPLGGYAFAFNLASYVVMVVVGVTTLATREIAQDKASAASITGASLPLLVGYGLTSAALLAALAGAIAPNALYAHMLRILSLSIPLTLLTLDWALSGLEAFRALGLARLLGQVCYGAGIVIFLGAGVSEGYRYAWLNVAGIAVTALVVWVLHARLAGRPQVPHTTFRGAFAQWRAGLPVTVSSAMVAVYYSADFILLGFLSTPAAVGQYTVAYRIPLAVLGFAALWNSVIYSHAAKLDLTALRRPLAQWLAATVAVAVVLCIVAVVLAHPLLRLAFGGQYAPASLYFQLLMVSVVLALVNGVLAHVLMAIGRESSLVRATALGAVTNIILNVVLIGSLGPEGSAIATIAAEAAVFVPLARASRRTIGRPA